MLAQSSWAWGSAAPTISAVSIFGESLPTSIFFASFCANPPSLPRHSKMAEILSHVSTPSSGWRVNPPVSDIFTRMLICCMASVSVLMMP